MKSKKILSIVLSIAMALTMTLGLNQTKAFAAGPVTTWADLNTAVSNAPTTGITTIDIGGNMSTSNAVGTIHVVSGQNIVIESESPSIFTITRASSLTSYTFFSVETGGQLTLKNITLDGNGTQFPPVTLPIVFVNYGTFTMDGATIQNAIMSSSTTCAGVQANYSTTTMKNGTKITGCQNNSGSFDYGGAMLIQGGTLNIEDSCSITGCRAVRGGAICLNTGTLNLSGTPDISGNTKPDGTTPCNVYLPTGAHIVSIPEPFSPAHPIGITSETQPTGSTPVNVTSATYSSDLSSCFVSDNPSYVIQNSGSGATQLVQLAVPSLTGTVNLAVNASTGEVTASASGGNTGSAGTLTYTWSGGATGTGTTKTPTLGTTATCTVTASGASGSLQATTTVYKVAVSKSGNTGIDDASITNAYGKAGDSVSIAYTLDSSGAASNTLTYSGAAFNPATVSTAGSGTSTYVIASGDSASGTVTLTATFAHTALPVISGAVSGLLSNAGITVNYTVNGGGTLSTTTDAGGNFSFTVPSASNVVITPSAQSGYNAPSDITLTNITANSTGHNLVYTSAGATIDVGLSSQTLPTGVSYGSNLFTIGTLASGSTITVTGTTTTNTVVVESGVTGLTLILDNVSITGSSGGAKSPIDLKGTANVTIQLKNGTTNTLDAYGASGKAGLCVPSGAVLTINGSGTLNAKGYNQSSNNGGAGIGGETGGACGTVNIINGLISAKGGNNGGAGIGGGYNGAGGTVNITGGTVDAAGGIASDSGSAGIGGGYNGAGGTITISNATVTAKGSGTGGHGGAGIGSGSNYSGAGGSITINSGAVTATGGDCGAGIGGGRTGAGGTINISGGTVTATGENFGAGIGGGWQGTSAVVTIGNTAIVMAASGGTFKYAIDAAAGSSGSIINARLSSYLDITTRYLTCGSLVLPFLAYGTNFSFTASAASPVKAYADSGHTTFYRSIVTDSGDVSIPVTDLSVNPTVATAVKLYAPTVTVQKDGAAWTSGTPTIQLSTSNASLTGAVSGTLSSSVYTFTGLDATTTYYVWKTSGGNQYMGKSITSASPAATLDYYTVTLTSGTGISATSGGGTYLGGSNVPISATVSSGYNWSGWTQTTGGTPVTATNSYTISGLSSAITYTAAATAVPPTTYALTVNLNGGNGGTTGGSYASGASVSIDAGTKSGYTFNGWSSSASGTFGNSNSASTTFTMPGNATTITASWTQNSVGGGVNPPPTGSNTIVIVDNKDYSIGTENKNGPSTTATVDQPKLTDEIAKASDSSSVIVPISANTNVTAQLVVKNVEDMAKKAMLLTVQTGNVAYNLNTSAIDTSKITASLGNADSKDIPFNVSISNSNAVVNGATVVVSPVEFTITATYNGKTASVDTFSCFVDRTIEITAEQANKITTAVVVEPDGSLRHVPTKVTVVNGKYYAVINSLTNSTYTVVWHSVEFTDAATSWAKDAINDMGSRMIVTGVGNNSYEPDRDITRAEFAAIVVRALGLAPGTGKSTFSDVGSSEWYCGYIATASAYGIIKGYSAATFAPNDMISREQAMTMLSRAMDITGLKPQLADSDISTLVAKYSDAAAASDYARSSIGACLKTGIITGRSSTTLAPKDYITRAEVAVVVQRLLQKSGLI